MGFISNLVKYTLFGTNLLIFVCNILSVLERTEVILVFLLLLGNLCHNLAAAELISQVVNVIMKHKHQITDLLLLLGPDIIPL